MTSTFPTEAKHIALVESRADLLCQAVNQASEAGVSPALLLPALIGVFREAGMIPADLDLGGLMRMLG